MNTKEKAFLKLALEYKDEYNSCPWWKFKKKREAKRNWLSALELMFRYSK